MRAIIRRIVGYGRLAATLAAALSSVMLSFHTAAQRAPDPDRFEQMVDYAQCIRENGYPNFPDPSPGGGFQFRIERGSAGNFEAAQQACRDKLPSGLMQGMQNPSPEQMDALVEFANCMRDNGVADFPDPSPEGSFVLTGRPNMGLGTPQVRRAMETCRESNSLPNLMIRIGG